ncbi:hypothetical protein DFJ63DRAFT_320552 [Scheffersomyces coipomensis]|uniref:uncharacterized protein n=1 Tax=Scheffersomyces coipomensis TaxID=1788519 RepID=UPI00315D2F25
MSTSNQVDGLDQGCISRPGNDHLPDQLQMSLDQNSILDSPGNTAKQEEGIAKENPFDIHWDSKIFLTFLTIMLGSTLFYGISGISDWCATNVCFYTTLVYGLLCYFFMIQTYLCWSQMSVDEFTPSPSEIKPLATLALGFGLITYYAWATCISSAKYRQT